MTEAEMILNRWRNEPVTLRDQFAMAALTGMLTNGFQPNGYEQASSTFYDYVKTAFKLADECMRRREQ